MFLFSSLTFERKTIQKYKMISQCNASWNSNLCLTEDLSVTTLSFYLTKYVLFPEFLFALDQKVYL